MEWWTVLIQYWNCFQSCYPTNRLFSFILFVFSVKTPGQWISSWISWSYRHRWFQVMRLDCVIFPVQTLSVICWWLSFFQSHIIAACRPLQCFSCSIYFLYHIIVFNWKSCNISNLCSHTWRYKNKFFLLLDDPKQSRRQSVNREFFQHTSSITTGRRVWTSRGKNRECFTKRTEKQSETKTETVKYDFILLDKRIYDVFLSFNDIISFYMINIWKLFFKGHF